MTVQSGIYEKGKIKKWSVGDYEYVVTMDAHSDHMVSLNALECSGKASGVSIFEDSIIKTWDVENHSVIVTLHSCLSSINTTTVFINVDQACLRIRQTKDGIKD